MLDRARLDPLRLGDGVHADQRAPDRRLLVGRPARASSPSGSSACRADGADGAVLQMVNHGLVVAGLFIVIAILYERTRTEDLTKMGGQAMRAPFLAALFLVIAMANLAMPGLGQLHRRVLHPQRRLPVEDRLRVRRRDRDRARRLLQPAALPADDAQPPPRGRRVARDLGPRRRHPRAAGRDHRRARALAGPDPRAGREVGRARRSRPRSRGDDHPEQMAAASD